ncbi:MAG TPA: aminopeptidase [Ktedonobacteraceae bacterium]|jgi:aminopeptidase
MTDLRVERMANVIVHYSLNIQAGDRLGIRCEPLATPLLEALVRETLHAGGHPEVFVQPTGVQEIVLREGSDEQIARAPQGWHLVVAEFEAMLDIQALDNTKSLSTVDPRRKALRGQAQGKILATQIQRSLQHTLRWTRTLFPTQAYAQDCGLSLREFEDLFYTACFLDEEDPVDRWHKLSRQQERYICWLQGKHQVHIQGPGTDLTFSIQGRTFLNDDGRGNLPGGEFFTAPVENSVNGTILYNLPTSYGGQELRQVWLRFAQGCVVEARAQSGQDYLEHMLGLDEGARRLGEFAFGNNPCVQRCTQNVLIDEKMQGTIHFALGASIPGTGGVNRSSLHWDMVYNLQSGSEVSIDGELFSKDGVILV